MKDISAKIIGGQVPKGKVRVSGAKNAATRLLAAALICDETAYLQNFPTELVDANHKFNFILLSGGAINIDQDNEIVSINSENFCDTTLPSYDYPIRTTYLLVPGLIKRSGRARIPYPGGCKIGSRGYDLHVMIWQKMGAKVTEHLDCIEIEAPGGFTAANIEFPISTVGGTENALISAAIAKGETIIRNAYITPEVSCLIDFLKNTGVKIDVIGNSYIRVVGKSNIQGVTFEVMPDRIEAITWLVYGILSKGDILIEDVPFTSMEIPLLHIKDAGVDYFRNTTSIRITPECLLNGKLQPFELATGTHPGVISDMQPFYVLLGLFADGISRIHDYRYPERIKYCDELAKFYPNMLEWTQGRITTFGRPDYIYDGQEVESTDLRGSMAVLIAALLARGESTVRNIEMALRGYNKLAEKLEALGVNIDLNNNN